MRNVCPNSARASCSVPRTPRQRIVIQREIARLSASGENPARLAAMKKGYDWQGEAIAW